MQPVWFSSLAVLSTKIAEIKVKVLGAGALQSIGMLLYILVLEILLGVMSIPLYLGKGYVKESILFNQKGFSYSLYLVRRRVTLSTMATFACGFVLYVTLSFYGVLSHGLPIFADEGGEVSPEPATVEVMSSESLVLLTDTVETIVGEEPSTPVESPASETPEVTEPAAETTTETEAEPEIEMVPETEVVPETLEEMVASDENVFPLDVEELAESAEMVVSEELAEADAIVLENYAVNREAVSESQGEDTIAQDVVVVEDSDEVADEINAEEVVSSTESVETPETTPQETIPQELVPEEPIAVPTDSVFAGVIDIEPLTIVADEEISIVITDFEIFGKEEGEELTNEEAFVTILGVSTAEEDLETGPLGPISDIVESVDSMLTDTVDVSDYEHIDSSEEKIEAIVDDLLVEEGDIGEFIAIEAENSEGESLAIAPEDISFEAGSVVMKLFFRDAPPGVYTIRGVIRNPITGDEYPFTQNFTWGVLTINTEKDSYVVGETARFEIGVLDPDGVPVCNAEAELLINDVAVSITNNPRCPVYNSENIIPDYEAFYTFTATGTYNIKLTVDNGGGPKTLKKTLIVTDVPTSYVVTRAQATRLFPFGPSPATITIKFNEAFQGSVTEVVPADFWIDAPGTTVTTSGDEKLITWDAIVAIPGETRTFSYIYNAPDISPMYYRVGPVEFDDVNGTVIYAEARSWGIANDSITNGGSASDLLGQYDETNFTDPVPAYTKDDANNGPNRFGLSLSNNYADTLLDSVNHRFFVVDVSNNRVLVYNLNTDNSFPNRVPDNVLGQPNFYSNDSTTTQSGMNTPGGIAYDAAGNRLFVSDINNNRVLVFDVATITDGENASNLLGHATFTSATSSATQLGFNSPRGLAYDAAGSRLFVADNSNNRVVVFDVASITDGENAVNLFGHSVYTSATSSVTQHGLSGPEDVAYDATSTRLFVLDRTNNRVIVYDTASIANGEVAVNVLGHGIYTSATSSATQWGMSTPRGITFDYVGQRLFVAESNNNRVLVFDVTSITNGENAVNVLGQVNFTSSTAATTQGGLSGARGAYYADGLQRLFITDASNHRIIAYDVTSISDGENAVDLIGQYDETSFTDPVPLYTKATLNNAPNKFGFNLNVQSSVLVDSVNDRLFVADQENHRVLVYNLNANDTLVDHFPDYVLGQPNFYTNTGAASQSVTDEVSGLALDTAGNRLFVSDFGSHRVLVFDVTSISNGENAVNVLGQPNFTSSTAATTQSGMYFPSGLAYDAANQRLFVVSVNSNRVTVYDVSTISDGENAVNVLGQPNFTSSTAATTQSGLSTPYGLAYDAANQRLFVADSVNDRVMVFDVASISDGENAINLLGHSTFTSATSSVTQSGMNNPTWVAYDSVAQRLFVSQIGARRVTTYDVATITDGENAVNVLGQSNFTDSTAATTQAGMNSPTGIFYATTSKQLFVPQSGNHRISIFDGGPNFVSGTVYVNEGVTTIGSGKTVKLLVNGGSGRTTTTDANGQYYFSDVLVPAGDVVTVFLDEQTEDGVTVTRFNAADVTGLNIYQDHLIVRSEDSTNLSSANLAVANDGDTDITAIYADNDNSLQVVSGKELYVWAGETFAPGASLNIDGNIEIPATATLNMAASALIIGGNLINAGTFTHTAGTDLTFDGGTTQTFNSGGGSIGSDVILTGATTLTLSSNGLNIGTSDFTIGPSATLVLDGNNLTVDVLSNSNILRARGSETISIGTMDTDSGTFVYTGDGDGAADTFTIAEFGTTTDYYNLLVTSTDGNDTFQKASSVLGISGTFTIASGTIDMNGLASNVTGTMTISGGTYQAGAGITTVTGTVTISGGTFTGGSGTVDLNGDLTISSGTYNAPSSTLLAGSFTNSGTFTHNSGTTTFDGVNQTISGATTTFARLTKTETTDNATDSIITLATDVNIAVGLVLDGLDDSDRINLVSSAGGTARTITFTGASTFTGDYLDVTDNTAVDNSTGLSLILNPSNSVDGGNTTGWFGGITGQLRDVSGGVSSSLNGKTVRLLVNGADSGVATDTANNAALGSQDAEFSLNGASLSTGDVITVYIDDETENGVLVTRYQSGASSGYIVYVDTLITRTEDGTALTNTNLDTANNADPGAASNDLTSIYDVSLGTLTVQSGKNLLIWGGDTFTPGGAVDANGNLTLQTNTSTFNAAANAINVAGNMTVTGTFTHTAGTDLTFDGTTVQTFDSGGGSIGSDVILSGSGTVVTLSTSTLNLGTNDLTIGSGATLSLAGKNLTADILTNNGTLQVRGSETIVLATMDSDSGTYAYTGDGDSAADSFSIADFGVNDYYNLLVTSTDSNDTFTGSGTIDINGSLTISSGTFTAPTNLTLAGDFTNSGTFTHNSGTVTLDGTNQTITGTATFATLTKSDTTDNATDAVLTLANDITITTAITLDGLDATDRLNLVSSVNGTIRSIDFFGESTFTGDYLDITDNRIGDSSLGIVAPLDPANSVDGGNTSGWFSVTPTPTTPTPTGNSGHTFPSSGIVPTPSPTPTTESPTDSEVSPEEDADETQKSDDLTSQDGSPDSQEIPGSGTLTDENMDTPSEDTTITFSATFTEDIGLGENNDVSEVTELQQFLNQYEGESLPVDGNYDEADVAAVKRFQEKYRKEILDIWGLPNATGYVGMTTRLRMNFMLGTGRADCPVFTMYNSRTLNNTGSEVGKTQEVLKGLGFYNGPINEEYDANTYNAMIKFQEQFYRVMLAPWGLTRGTGYKYKTTNKFLNYLLGCDTEATYLEGRGEFDY